MSKLSLVVLVLLGKLLLATPAQAQRLDPEPFAPWRFYHQREHIAGGAALDLVTQLPILPKSMRNTLPKRLLLVTFVGVAFEAGQADAHQHEPRQNGYGFGLADLACNTLGALAMEFVSKVIR